jgi:hypothetical protein
VLRLHVPQTGFPRNERPHGNALRGDFQGRLETSLRRPHTTSTVDENRVFFRRFPAQPRSILWQSSCAGARVAATTFSLLPRPLRGTGGHSSPRARQRTGEGRTCHYPDGSRPSVLIPTSGVLCLGFHDQHGRLLRIVVSPRNDPQRLPASVQDVPRLPVRDSHTHRRRISRLALRRLQSKQEASHPVSLLRPGPDGRGSSISLSGRGFCFGLGL